MTDALSNVLIVAYLLIVLAMIGVILLQRSEGGGLGIGGGSGGLMSVRGSANLLTRTTAILAALFFATAIGLTVLSQLNNGTQDILNKATQSTPGSQTVFDALKGNSTDTGTSGGSSSGNLPVPAGNSSGATSNGSSSSTTTAPAANGTTTNSGTAPSSDSTSSSLPVPQSTGTTGTQGGQGGGN